MYVSGLNFELDSNSSALGSKDFSAGHGNALNEQILAICTQMQDLDRQD